MQNKPLVIPLSEFSMIGPDEFDAGVLPSGSYLYRLTSPKGEFTKMMMLLK